MPTCNFCESGDLFIPLGVFSSPQIAYFTPNAARAEICDFRFSLESTGDSGKHSFPLVVSLSARCGAHFLDNRQKCGIMLAKQSRNRQIAQSSCAI